MASMRNCGSDHFHSCRSSSERPTHRPFLVPTSTTTSLITSGLPVQLILPQVYGPSHGGKLTVQPDVSLLAVRRSQPDRGVAGQPAISKWCATQDHLARRQRGGVGTEVGHAPYAIAACKVQHRRFGIDPTEVVACEQAPAKGEGAPVEIERG